MNIYLYFAKNILLPSSDLVLHTKIHQELNFLEKSQWWTYEKLQDYQNKKLQNLVTYSYNNVPYYHRIFKEIGIHPTDIKTSNDLENIPILTKEIVRKNFSDMMPKNQSLKSLILGQSSGSTGEPFKYYLDKNSYSCLWANHYRGWKWTGYDFGDSYVKLSLNPRKNFKKRIQDRMLNCLYLYALNVDDHTLSVYIKQIRKYNPKIIRGYASLLYLVARYMQEHNINDIKPKSVISTGDMLFDNYRELIESQFNCKVYDGYGGDGIAGAFECENHDGYHMPSECAIYEFVKDGNNIAAGERGEIILTNLTNYGMPFIRYKIGDVGIPSSDLCSCGRGLPLMDKIEGRDTDIISTPTGKYLIVHFFTALFEYIEGVDQFQIIQNKIDNITIKIVKNRAFTQDDLVHIVNTVQTNAGEDVSIDVEFVKSIPLSRSGKRRFVISNVKLQL